MRFLQLFVFFAQRADIVFRQNFLRLKFKEFYTCKDTAELE